MPTFGLIAEGVTDQIVLDHLIERICEGSFADDVDTTFLQPLRDATDAHTAPHGGWELVLEYCGLRAAEVLATNDFMVVQIDTDCGDHENFGVPLTKDGKDRGYEELVEAVQNILRDRIGAALYAKNADRICFAICVHSTESWMLLILFDKDQCKNSFVRLKREWQRAHDYNISKTGRDYVMLSDGIKRKRLDALASGDNSLSVFLKRLLEICPAPDAGAAGLESNAPAERPA